MRIVFLFIAALLAIISQARHKVGIGNESVCTYGSSSALGRSSPAEHVLQSCFLQSECARLPTMAERLKYYNALKTGELSGAELSFELQSLCKSLPVQSPPWPERMPNHVYTWTVDFHPSPGACNFPVYKDIGVVLHAEVDHHPFCEFSGVCRQRLNAIFGLGAYMAGFALDPDHSVLKRDFYEIYKDDPEFNRIDAFMCSHPAANCELFEAFGKPMVVFSTTRLEFGRNDQNVPWRVREIGKWNAWGELASRQRDWIKFVIKHYSSGRLALVANSVYDVEYIHYFTGIRPLYIPSWCGDLDGSFGLRNEWVGCVLNDTSVYNPRFNYSLIVPYKSSMWAGQPDVDENHGMYKEFMAAKANFTAKYKKEAPVIKHSNHELRNHSPETYKQYKALIFVPYQTSVMTFFELYRQNIPIFAPSLHLLVDWHQRFQILSGRIYGWPERCVDLITNYTKKPIDDSVPDPNSDMNVTSNEYWFAFSDMYVFEHVQLFDSWSHLMELLYHADLPKISKAMAATNALQRDVIMKKWDEVFRKLVPNRDRSQIVEQLNLQVDEEDLSTTMRLSSSSKPIRLPYRQQQARPLQTDSLHISAYPMLSSSTKAVDVEAPRDTSQQSSKAAIADSVAKITNENGEVAKKPLHASSFLGHFWKQYERYTSLSTFSSPAYNQGASHCEDDTRDKVMFLCAETLHDKIKQAGSGVDMTPHWPRKDDVVSCQYSIIQQTPMASNTAAVAGFSKADIPGIWLRIFQRDCLANYTLSKGGSSFEITATGGGLLKECEVVDRFDDAYDVFCPPRSSSSPLLSTNVPSLYKSTTTSSSSSSSSASSATTSTSSIQEENPCYKVTATLDFEHFDAFAERGTFFEAQYRPLRKVLLDGSKFCRSTVPLSISPSIVSPLSSHFASSAGYWAEAPNSAPAADSSANFSYAESLRWTWKWKHYNNETNSPLNANFVDCLSKRRVIMLGESHMRFNWDALAFGLNDEQTKAYIEALLRKHTNAEVDGGALKYEMITFAKNFAKRVDSICDQVEREGGAYNYTLVVQLGAWDLTFWSSQYFVGDPNSGQALLKVINSLVYRPCSQNVRLVWVTNVPYPHCQLPTTLGAEKEPNQKMCIYARHARNNYAIKSSNDFFISKLLDMNFPLHSLQIVDAFEAILPRLQFAEYACQNHFLCHLDKTSYLVPTPPGLVVLEGIKRALCDVALLS